MAHRTFRDELGRDWDVWEVVPTVVERRMSTAPPVPLETDRRKTHETRVVVPETLQKGWLAFQSGRERRRLSPIPRDWQELTSSELVDLLHRADHRTRARRLIE